MKRLLSVLMLLGVSLILSVSEGQGQIIPQAYYRMTGDLTAGQSLRFRSAGPAHLIRTPSSAGNQQIFTISLWAKPSGSIATGGPYTMVSAGAAVANRFLLSFINNTLFAGPSISGSNYISQTAAVFRDPSAWYHIVLAVDTTQAVANNRMQLWVNGKAISFASAVTIPQNATLQFMGTVPHTIGISSYGGEAYDGYLADVTIIDGQQWPAAFFGGTDNKGIWVPLTYVGAYGTNGSRLAFADTSAATAAALGKDTSGRGNNWTPNNISVTAGSSYDPVTDYPRMGNDGGNGLGNYATWNPLHRSVTNVANPAEGNLYISNGSSAGTWPGMGGTMAVNSGKWYYEFSYSGAGSLASSFVGFAETDITMDSDIMDQPTKLGGWLLRNDSSGLGEAYYNFSGGPASFGGGADAPASGTVMLALDLDNNKFWVGRGGTWFNSGNPASGSNGISFSAGKTLMPFISPCCITGGGAVYFSTNFGQQAFAYTAPTGFKALNTYNLPNPGIGNPDTYMKIAAYTGNGSFMSIGDPVKLAGSKQLANSLRFRSIANTYLNRTGALGNRRVWTWSAWLKRSSLNANIGLFTDNATANTTGIHFNSSNQLGAYVGNGANNTGIISNALFNDTSAWYHVVWAVDTTQATANLRNRLYVNGAEITSFSAATYPAQNYDSGMNNSTAYQLGRNTSATPWHFDGYMADVYFIDGQQLAPSSFGETDANGNWVAKATSGLTYGTNGFHLDFSNSNIVAGERVAYDSSGNNFHFIPNNFTLPNTATFASGSSAYMTKTGTTGDRQKWTWSGWVRRSAVGGNNAIFSDGTTSNTTLLYFNPSNQLGVYVGDGSTNTGLITSATYSDPSVWYHVVWAVDTTQATAASRNRLYVNGAEVTAFASATYPTLNFNSAMNNSNTYNLGRNTASNPYIFDGHMSEVYYIDGQQLTPADFAQTISSKWVPKTYTGTYGTNGFRLNFSNKLNATTLGADSSGNANNFTANNMSTSLELYDDILRDTPTPYNDGTYDHGNYATLNPLFVQAAALSLGNLQIAGTPNAQSVGTQRIAVPTYFEVTFDSIDSSNGYPMAGIARRGTVLSGYLHDNTNTVAVDRVNKVYRFGSNMGTLSGTTFSSGDICQVAFDPVTGRLWFGRNGTWLGGGDPVSGNNPAASGLTENDYFPVVSASASQSAVASVNFGQRPFTYAMPAGYKSLNTNNVTNAGFVPDLVITKNRSATAGWAWYDRMRGVTMELDSSSTAIDTASSTGLLNFQNGGFTAAGSSKFNTSGQNYVSYMFKKGATPGFDIVQYTGTGAARTISHTLGVKPAMMIIKNTTGTVGHWVVYHQYMNANPSYGYLTLSTSNGFTLESAGASRDRWWNSTEPTSSVLSVGAGSTAENNASGSNYVAYLFSEVPGFSKFGTYTGNGSAADGPFIHTGFKPALVFWKRIDTSGGWEILDNGRNPTNPATDVLYLDASQASAVIAGDADFTANGFKLRDNSARNNASGGTYIYAAFAEKPFKYSNAR